MYVVDNESSNQKGDLQPFCMPQSTLFDASIANSLPSKHISTKSTTIQPDILTHGNRANVNVHVTEEQPCQNQTPVTDKKTMSSLYVDMMHDFLQSNAQSHNNERVSNDLNRDNENISTIPVFVFIPCVPINSVQSTRDINTKNETKEIRLGNTFLFYSLNADTSRLLNNITITLFHF